MATNTTADKKLSTWREKRYTLQPGLNDIVFPDTKPNHIYINNLGGGTLYLGVSVIPSNTMYEKKIDSFGEGLYARQTGVTRIQIYSDNTNPNDILLITYEDTFQATTMAASTAASAPASGGGGGGGGVQDVNVKSFAAALPAGNNHIGTVTIDSMPPQTFQMSAIPAGTNHIGSVDIDRMPPLPEGVSHIGSVNVDNAITIESMPPVEVVSEPVRAKHHYFESSVGTSEVVYDCTDGGALPDENVNHISFISNDGNTDLFVSFDDVTATATSVSGKNGVIRLAAGESLTDLPRSAVKIRFIRASGTGNVRFMGV
jgi:hypothetical protein